MAKTWMNERTVIYQIFIDRFAGYRPDADPGKPEYAGGNIKGIIDNFDYILDLGVNCIWLSPFFESPDYHGYNTTNYFEVDEHYGTKDDLRKLISDCHRHDIKVMIDFTANHCSDLHPFFQDAIKNKSSQYRDWFYFKKWPDKYVTFLDFHNLPKWNLENKETKDYIIGAAEYWVKEFKIDGIRLDHVVGPKDEFWIEFARRIKSIDSNVALIGEVAFFGTTPKDFKTMYMDGIKKLLIQGKFFGKDMHSEAMRHYLGVLDGVLDFQFSDTVNLWASGDIGAREVKKRLIAHYGNYDKDYLLPSFLDNQDKDRILHVLNNDYSKLKEIVQLQFSQKQPQIIYYGTEVGMTSVKTVAANTGLPADLPARGLMNWEPQDYQKELLEFYRGLIRKTVNRY